MNHFSRILLLAALALLALLGSAPAAARHTPCPPHPTRPGVCVLDPGAPALAQLSGAPPIPFLAEARSGATGSWPFVVGAVDLDGPGGASQAIVGTDRYFDTLNDRQSQRFTLDAVGNPLRQQQLAGGSGPEAIQVLDSDHDGVMDLMLALAGENTLLVYRGEGGALAAPTRIALSAPPTALAALDMSGDLRDDLVAVVGQELHFWQSTPTGLVALDLVLPFANDSTTDLAAGDFNNDGIDDLAALRASGYGGADVLVFLQTPEGAFVAPYPLAPQTGGFAAGGIAAGDLNSDGVDDLAVTAGGNLPDTYLSVFLQSGGVLTFNRSYATYHVPSAVEIADLDHDGRDDLVLLNDGWRTLSFFKQNGGTLDVFQAADVPYSDRYRPDALAIADLDGDGGLDVALVGQAAGLTVLPNLFGAPVATITSPAHGDQIGSGPLVVRGSASLDAVRVQVRLKGIQEWQDTPVISGTWSLTLNVPPIVRVHTIEARAVDGEGRVQAPPAKLRVRVVRPTAMITSPADGAVVNSGPLTVSGTASITAARVEVRVVETGLAWLSTPVVSGTWALSLTMPLIAGFYTIEARAVDAGGLLQDPPVSIRVQVIIPCFAVAENDGVSGSPDRLVQVNTDSGKVLVIGATGTDGIHAMAFRADGTLFSAYQGRLGRLDLETGIFLPATTPLGSGRGSFGNVTINSIFGLSFAPDGELYGLHRRNGSGKPDLLVKIDPVNGKVRADSFGAGIDYLPIIGVGVSSDLEDIAFDGAGKLYGLSGGQALARIDPTSGAATITGSLTVTDMEGLTVAPDGTLFGTTGILGTNSTRNRLWMINALTGGATVVGPLSSQRDYEAIGCLPPGVTLLPSTIRFAAQIGQLLINNAATQTASPNVTLAIAAASEASLASANVAQVAMAEYHYDATAGSWIANRAPAGSNGQYGFDVAVAGIPWLLDLRPGVRYLQVWPIDTSGQLTPPARSAMINYVPPIAALDAGEAHVYRYVVNAGETVTIQLESVSGDADLIVWSEGSEPPLVSNQSTAWDSLAIEVNSDGLYQIEVHSATQASYRLSVALDTAKLELRAGTLSTVVDGTKAVPSVPTIPLADLPSVLDSPVRQTERHLYLPLLLR